MSDPALKAPWELVDSVGPDGKPKEKEPDAGDYMSALSMLLGLVAFWFRVRVLVYGLVSPRLFSRAFTLLLPSSTRYLHGDPCSRACRPLHA